MALACLQRHATTCSNASIAGKPSRKQRERDSASASSVRQWKESEVARGRSPRTGTKQVPPSRSLCLLVGRATRMLRRRWREKSNNIREQAASATRARYSSALRTPPPRAVVRLQHEQRRRGAFAKRQLRA